MSARRTAALGPTTRNLVRHAAEPIAFAASATGAANAGAAVIALASKVGPLLVLVDPNDSKCAVFVVPRHSDRAKLFSTKFPHWIVGVFNRDARIPDIADAIKATRESVKKVTT